MLVRLERVAHVRSGDKGNTSNIAVIAYSDEFYSLLKAQLTAAKFKAFYRGAIKGEVTRYEADNLAALNFVAEGALGGGVSRMAHLYEQVPQLWGRWVVSGGQHDEVRTRLLPSLHGDASGARGAAWLWRWPASVDQAGPGHALTPAALQLE